jgi:hypothetical protein
VPKGDDTEAAAAREVADAVEIGADDIEIPEDLVDEPESDAASEPSGTLYSQLLSMPFAEKIKLALRGNRAARTLLSRDRTKSIRIYVLENPRITEDEIVALARNRETDGDILSHIVSRREWMKLYQVRHALVKNPKTPFSTAIQALPTLQRRDIELIARSRDVPEGVVAQARRLVASGQKRG